MKKVILYIKILLLMAVIIALYAFAQQKNQLRSIDDIEVEFMENQPTFLSVEIVNKLLIQSENDLLNKPKTSINLHQIEEEVRKNKMIENAEVFITPSGKLKANIVQRVPIARVNKGSKAYYIDRQGLVMPLSANYSKRVPLITGVVDKEMEQEVFLLINKINKSEFYKKQIIGIHRKLNGDYLLSTRIGIHKILLGKLDGVDDKLKKLEVFYKKEWNTANLKKYKLINLKYNHQVVCSK